MKLFSKNKSVLPNQEAMQWLVHQAKAINTNTPDIAFLEQFSSQLVFEYGDMQRRHPAHELIAEVGEFKGSAFTRDPYVLWKHSLQDQSYPVALPQGFRSIPRLPIKGELYLIPPYQFLTLDKHRQNTVMFERRRIELIIPFRKVKWFKDRTDSDKLNDMFGQVSQKAIHTEIGHETVVKAWAYFGIEEKFPVDAGFTFKRAEIYETNHPIKTLGGQRQYYHFSRLEYGDKTK